MTDPRTGAAVITHHHRDGLLRTLAWLTLSRFPRTTCLRRHRRRRHVSDATRKRNRWSQMRERPDGSSVTSPAFEIRRRAVRMDGAASVLRHRSAPGSRTAVVRPDRAPCPVPNRSRCETCLPPRRRRCAGLPSFPPNGSAKALLSPHPLTTGRPRTRAAPGRPGPGPGRHGARSAIKACAGGHWRIWSPTPVPGCSSPCRTFSYSS